MYKRIRLPQDNQQDNYYKDAQNALNKINEKVNQLKGNVKDVNKEVKDVNEEVNAVKDVIMLLNQKKDDLNMKTSYNFNLKDLYEALFNLIQDLTGILKRFDEKRFDFDALDGFKALNDIITTTEAYNDNYFKKFLDEFGPGGEFDLDADADVSNHKIIKKRKKI